MAPFHQEQRAANFWIWNKPFWPGTRWRTQHHDVAARALAAEVDPDGGAEEGHDEL